MSRNEKIKEQIGWLKVIFGLLVAIVVSMIGWMATNYKDTEPIMMITSMVIVLFLVYAIAMVNIKAFNKIDELEDL